MRKSVLRIFLALCTCHWISHNGSWCEYDVFPEFLLDLQLLIIPGCHQLFFITALWASYPVLYGFAHMNNSSTPHHTDNVRPAYGLLYYQILMYVAGFDKWFLSYLPIPLYAVVVVTITAVLCMLECYHGTVALWFFVASNVFGMNKKFRQSLREAKDFVTREGITKTIVSVVTLTCWHLCYRGTPDSCEDFHDFRKPLFAYIGTIRTFFSMIKFNELLSCLFLYYLLVDVASNITNWIAKAFLNWLPSHGTVNLQNAIWERYTEVRENSTELVFAFFFINFLCAVSLIKSNEKSIIFYIALLLFNSYTVFRKRAKRFYEKELRLCNELEPSQRSFWDYAKSTLTGLLLTCLVSAEMIFAFAGKIIKISISSISEWSQELRVLEIAKFKNSFLLFLALNMIDHFCLSLTFPEDVHEIYLPKYHFVLLIYKCYSFAWNEVTSLCGKHLLKNLSESSETQRKVRGYVKSIVLLWFLVCVSSWTSWMLIKSYLFTNIETFAFLLMNFIQLVQPLNDLVKFTLIMYNNDQRTTHWIDNDDLLLKHFKLFCEILIFLSVLVRGNHGIRDFIGISMFFYWRIYIAGRNLWRRRRCPICLDLVSNSPDTPCGHDNHYECLYRWLAIKNTCPLCRRPIATGF